MHFESAVHNDRFKPPVKNDAKKVIYNQNAKFDYQPSLNTASAILNQQTNTQLNNSKKD